MATEDSDKIVYEVKGSYQGIVTIVLKYKFFSVMVSISYVQYLINKYVGI